MYLVHICLWSKNLIKFLLPNWLFGSFCHQANAKAKIHMSAMWLFHILQKQKQKKKVKILCQFFFNSWFCASWFNVNKKVQLNATVCRHLFTAKSFYMFRASQHPSSGVLKTVSATSGIGHDTGTATSFHRGLIRPDQAMVEGGSCTSIMTYTRGSRYSF